VTGLVTQETLALIFLHPWLPAILGSVPLTVAVDALNIGAIARWRLGGHAGRPRLKPTCTFWPSSWWCSTSGGTSTNKLLRHEGVDLGGLLVGRQADVQDLSDAGLGVDLVFRLKLLLVLFAAVSGHKVKRASVSLLVLQNLDEPKRVLIDALVHLEARLLHLHDDIRRDVRR
jgi:hypothetical protein